MNSFPALILTTPNHSTLDLAALAAQSNVQPNQLRELRYFRTIEAICYLPGIPKKCAPVALNAQDVMGCSIGSPVLSLVRASLSQKAHRPSEPTVARVPCTGWKAMSLTAKMSWMPWDGPLERWHLNVKFRVSFAWAWGY